MTAPEILPSSTPTAQRWMASAALGALSGRIEGRDHVAIGEILDCLGRTGVGLTIVLLSLLTLIPVPGPLGIGLGTCLAFVALQVVAGSRRLWLPQWLRRRSLPAPMLQKMCAKATPWLQRAEGRMRRRRLKGLTGTLARTLIGLLMVLLGIAIALPLPTGNLLPAIALILLALSLTARDGIATLAALGVSVLALSWTGVLLVAGAQITDRLLQWTGLA